MSATDHFDVAIVGAGVIGLAVAYRLSCLGDSRHQSIVILEQNQDIGQETSSRNSEVIHAGIYYPQDSLKARLCLEGKARLYHFCKTFDIPHRQLGKLIIASETQQHKLDAIAEQAQRNGVDDLEEISYSRLRQLEPAVNANKALLSPTSGIIDSHAYMTTLLHESQKTGALFSPLTTVTGIEPHSEGYLINTRCQETDYAFTCSRLVNAAGLGAQRLAQQIATFPHDHIPPQQLVKGNYFSLQGKSPFQHLVYPVPEENLKGLGVHVTLDMSGQARFGPDTENIETIDYQVDSSREPAFVKAISMYYPDIQNRKILPAYSGIRPKLVSHEGAADFVIQGPSDTGFPGLVQLFGIESPGLTASLAIAERVVTLLDQR